MAVVLKRCADSAYVAGWESLTTRCAVIGTGTGLAGAVVRIEIAAVVEAVEGIDTFDLDWPNAAGILYAACRQLIGGTGCPEAGSGGHIDGRNVLAVFAGTVACIEYLADVQSAAIGYRAAGAVAAHHAVQGCRGELTGKLEYDAGIRFHTDTFDRRIRIQYPGVCNGFTTDLQASAGGIYHILRDVLRGLAAPGLFAADLHKTGSCLYTCCSGRTGGYQSLRTSVRAPETRRTADCRYTRRQVATRSWDSHWRSAATSSRRSSNRSTAVDYCTSRFVGGGTCDILTRTGSKPGNRRECAAVGIGQSDVFSYRSIVTHMDCEIGRGGVTGKVGGSACLSYRHAWGSRYAAATGGRACVGSTAVGCAGNACRVRNVRTGGSRFGA